MRKDMAKVVTERPRDGHEARSMKTGRRLSWNEIDDAIMTSDGPDEAIIAGGPSRHPISRRRQYGWDSKSFTDVLGPLRGYLRKQVGRRWDAVFSELSQTLDRRSITGQHIWDHVQWEVSLYVQIAADGRVWSRGGRRYMATLIPLGHGRLYVDPRDGVLRAAHNPDCTDSDYDYGWQRRGQPPDPVTKIVLDDAHWLEQVDGIWYDFTVVWDRDFDAVAGEYVKRRRVVKRQLNRRELRERKLANRQAA